MKHSRIREVSIEVTVGAFLFMVLLALGAFTIILSRESLFTPTYYMTIEFDEVMGIREGDNVFVRGVITGKVRSIVAEDERVLVTAALDRPITLHEDYVIEILPSSMLGGRLLQINEGSRALPRLDDGVTIVGQTPVDLVDQATRAVQSLRDALEGDDGMLERIGSAMSNVQALTERLSRGEGTIGKLLTDDTVYENLETISANLRDMSEKIAQGQGSLGRFLADEGKVYEDVSAITADIRAVTARLSTGEGLLGQLLSADDTVYADLQSTLQSLRRVAEAVDQGEGTLGRLARDPELYDDARLLIHELRATIDDFRETAPITTFTSILFGAF